MVELSIIIPAYNEEKRIEKTVEEYIKYFKNYNYELLIIPNGCRDKTEEITKNLSKKYSQIKYKTIKEAIGKGGAIKEGFKIAQGNLIGFVDADNSTKPKDFEDLIKNINNYNCITASRYIKGAIVKPKQKITRIIASRVFNFLVRILFGLKIKDTQCIDGSTEIYGILNGVPIRKEIRDLKRILNLDISKKGKKYAIYDLKDSFLVPSLNKKQEVELAPVNSIITIKDTKRLYSIKLQSGRTTNVSEDHPLSVFKKGKIIYKKAKYIKIGDKLPVLINLNKKCCSNSVKEINLIEEIKKKIPYKKNEFMIHNWIKSSNITSAKQLSKRLNISYRKANYFYKNDRVPLNYFIDLKLKHKKLLKISYLKGKFKIPIKIKIDQRLMRLIGYFLSEGCIDKDDYKKKNRYSFRLSFNKKEEDLIHESKNLLKSIFNIKTSIYTQNNVTVISTQSRILCMLFKDIFCIGTCANDKKLPEFAYCLSKHLIGNLLDTYILGDGTISKHNLANSICIRANSSSKKLIKDLQFILLKFKVTSTVYSSKRGKEKINNRNLRSSNKLRWNINIHMGSNILKLLKYLSKITKKNSNLIKIIHGKWPSLFERNNSKFNKDLGLAKVVNINNSNINSEWYDFKVQSEIKPNMNFIHDCGIISHNCGAKLFKKQAIKKIIPKLDLTRWAFDVDLLLKLKNEGYKIKEYPTIWKDSLGSKLKMHKAIPEMFLSLTRLKLINSRFKFVIDIYDKFPESIKIHHKLR